MVINCHKPDFILTDISIRDHSTTFMADISKILKNLGVCVRVMEVYSAATKAFHVVWFIQSIHIREGTK